MGRLPEDIRRKWSKWDCYIERASHLLSAVEAGQTVAGLRHLQEILGDGWLANALEGHHPLLGSLINGLSIPWHLALAGRIGNSLYLLRGCRGYDRLTHKLLMAADPDAFLDWLPELWVAAMIAEAGYCPEIYPKCGGSEPDARATIEGMDVYFEAARLRASNRDKQVGRMHEDLRKPIEEMGLLIAGRIEKVLWPKHSEYRALLEKVELEARRAKETGQGVEIRDPNAVLFIAPWNRAAEFEEWQQREKVRGLEGSRTEFQHDIGRLGQKVDQECGQLRNVWGVIVLYDTATLLSSSEYISSLALEELKRVLYARDKIIAGVIISTMLAAGREGPTERIAVAAPIVTVQRPIGGGLLEDIIVVESSERSAEASKLRRLWRSGDSH